VKAIVNTGPGRLKLQDLPTPEPGPGQVRVRTTACGICATDLDMIRGWDRTGFPAIPGHEWSGVVDAVGEGGDASLIGRRCVAENVLADGGEVGFEHPGGYASRLLTEADKLHLLPDDHPLDVAVLIEPLAVSVRALRRLRLEDRSRALIFGDGPVGLLLAALLARERVADIVLVGGRDSRLDTARAVGATRTVNYHAVEGDLAAGVRAAVGAGFPNVLEASGAAAALGAGISLAGRGGRALVVGDYGAARADFRWNEVLHGELEIIGSSASAGAWPEAVRLAVAGELPLGKFVTHRRPAERFEEAMALVRRRASGCIKAVLMWGQD